MSTFDKRESDFENKFAHDSELQFKVSAKRDKLLGLWAAKKLGLNDNEAEAYAKKLVEIDVQKKGDREVLEKIVQDFKAKNVAIDAGRIEIEMERLLQEAKKIIMAA
jgi:hypothetical protein